MKKGPQTFLVLCWLFVASAYADGPALRFAQDIDFGDQGTEHLTSVTLGIDVYAATGDGFPDLRILDSSDREVAFVLRKMSITHSETVRESWTAKRRPSAKPLDNGGLEVTIELDRNEPQPLGLKLISPLRNFERRVQIEASTDGTTWQRLVTDGLIFDYAQFIDVRNDSLTFSGPEAGGNPATAPRLFRITIDNVTQEQQSELMELTRRLRGKEETGRSESTVIRRQPFRIERIEFWRDAERSRVTGDKLVEYPLSDFRAEQDAKQHLTYLYVKSHRAPLEVLIAVTSERNFSRQARVEIERPSAGASAWQSIGTGLLTRLTLPKVDRQNLSLRFSETRQSRYRLAIENQDSQPLDISGLRAEGAVYEAVFLARPDTKYRLCYGNASIGSPKYDTAAISASIAANTIPVPATLGAQVVLASDTPMGPAKSTSLLNDNRVLLTGIGLITILLALGLYRAVRRLDHLPHE